MIKFILHPGLTSQYCFIVATDAKNSEQVPVIEPIIVNVHRSFHKCCMEVSCDFLSLFDWIIVVTE